MINQKICKGCKNIHDFKDCPYCREIKKREDDGKISMPSM